MKTEYKLKFFGDDSGESLKNFIKESAEKAASKTFNKFVPSEEEEVKPVVAEDVVKIAAELLYTTPKAKDIVLEDKPVVVEEPKKQKTILESKFETLQKSLSEDLREYKQKIIEEVSKSTSKQNPYYLGDSGSGEVKLLSMDDVETKSMSRQARVSYLANNDVMTYDTSDKLFHFRYSLNQDLLTDSNVKFNNANTTGNLNVGGTLYVTSSATGGGDLTISGNASIGKNLVITGNTILQGNLLVTGYTTTVNTSSLIVSDALFHLNDISTSSNVDIGFTGNYNDGTYRHAGLFRDSNDGVWKFFDGYTPETNTATKIYTANVSYVDAGLKVGNFTANGSATVATTLGVTGNVTAGNLVTSGAMSSGPMSATTGTFSSTLNVTGATTLGSYGSIKSLVETATITGAAPSATTTFDWMTQAVQYYTSSATTNFTLNIRGNGSTSLNSVMATGQSATIALLVTNGATPYYPNVFQIDGTTSGVTTKFQNGTTITSGNANSIDIYSITVIKTASATYTVLIAQSKFG